ncbi:TerC family protein [Burkholderia glumae]|uniref:TerC family protein n=1 Tax=Burkholderia glumae TaxID=337 RepID=A0AAQ0BTF8_BURGL|nr:TerC family protein [Burkholderia glumae]ACR30055.1 Integral membrane protein TerC [Burkholderia glumae BGR1]AJY67663.1 integral membrane, YjbE family protein [Burkholderia glumae LMG 2196 = ATCC 33617]KHJ60244.1 membrane protein [Burkholderia glumae]MCM2482300.1 TerC family protein [Burkholderia glumae]MCM2507557.1 TerC family protein [Burkholderia glumae]
MIEFLATLHWGAVLQIVVIDLLLGGDNAVVIALACRNLPDSQRLRGVIWGTVGAIVLRVVLITFAVLLLDIPFLKLAGGLLLLWIGAKLLVPDDAAHDGIQGADRLWAAVRTIIVADAVMSIDNVIAIAGAAERADPEHRLALVIFGLVVSIPVIVWGSTLVLKLLDRFPVIVMLGAALLGWIAGGLIIADPALDRWPQLDAPAAGYGASIAGAILVVVAGMAWKRRRRPAGAH